MKRVSIFRVALPQNSDSRVLRMVQDTRNKLDAWHKENIINLLLIHITHFPWDALQ